MLKKLVILTGLLLTSVTAQASLISHFGYERDSAANVVTGGGLEWLKWDVTKGMSINSALSTHAAQGWRLASNVEMAALFNTFQFSSNVFTGVERLSQSVASPWSLSEDNNYIRFQDLFGRTYAHANVCTAQKVVDCYSATDNYITTRAWFGSDDDKDNKFKLAEVLDDFKFITPNVVAFKEAYASISGDHAAPTDASRYVGVALVRTFDTAPVAVPTPGPIGLLALGLVALGYRRRQVLAR
jgi:hypothetical protein